MNQEENYQIKAVFKDGDKYSFFMTDDGLGIAGKNEARREMINLILTKHLNNKFINISTELKNIYTDTFNFKIENETQFFIDMNRLRMTYLSFGLVIDQDSFLINLNNCLKSEEFSNEFKFYKE